MAKAAKNSKKKVVLAYSGGLDTSVILTYLKENYDYEFYLISYNQILRTYCYCEHGLDKLKENPLNGAVEFSMLKTIVTRDYWTDELRDNAEAYDKEFGFEEYK